VRRPCGARRALAGPALALGLAAGLAAPSSAAPPAEDYALHCMGCHRADGGGAAGLIPSLVEVPGRLLAVPGGRAFLVRVPGVAQSTLDDARLAAVLNWMLERFSPRAVASGYAPFTAEEVGRLRAAPLVALAAERARLLGALGADAAAVPTEPDGPAAR
jgi:mono/diheme cytochrome c family protein